MAESVSRNIMRELSLGALLLFLITAAYAEGLPDPIRPPTALGMQSDAAATSGPVLQSVLISPDRRLAVISGQTLRVGDKFGDARVTRISEGTVDLSSNGSVQTLKLYPDVGKHPAPAKPKAHKQ